jgi:pimeloyl-ACP methyl ester carboxylesterase
VSKVIALFLVTLGLIFAPINSALAVGSSYDYPFTNPYVATVVGTPLAHRAPLPERIPEQELELTVFPDRTLPSLLWYDRRLRYSLVYQKGKAPLVFVIGGAGASYQADRTRLLQKVLFQAGFHVLALPSPTHPNFIASASQTQMPGYLEEDAQDLYRVMQLAWRQVREEIEVSAFSLAGYSLGATQAAFVAKLDEEKKAFNFSKVLLINPVVSLYHSATRLDKLLAQNLRGGMDNLNSFVDEVFNDFSAAYKHGSFVNLSSDFLYAAYRESRPSNVKLAALIGLVYRFSLANMAFTSDVLTNAGYIKPKNLMLTVTDSLTDFFKVAIHVSFLDYFHDLLVPYLQSREPRLTEEALIDKLSLKSIGDYLRRTQGVVLMTNADDIILAPQEVEYLRQVFRSRAKIYPHGGHLGNMGYRENVADMLRFLSN